MTPALVAAMLSGGAAAVLLRPVPTAGAVPAGADEAGASTGDDADAVGGDHRVAASPPDDDARERQDAHDALADPPAAPDRIGHRGSGGSERYARSLAGSHPDGPADPLAGWTVGPGVGSDVAFRRPGVAPGAVAAPSRSNGSASRATPDAADGSGASDHGADPSDRSDATGSRADARPARDPYRRPNA